MSRALSPSRRDPLLSLVENFVWKARRFVDLVYGPPKVTNDDVLLGLTTVTGMVGFIFLFNKNIKNQLYTLFF